MKSEEEIKRKIAILHDNKHNVSDFGKGYFEALKWVLK